MRRCEAGNKITASPSKMRYGQIPHQRSGDTTFEKLGRPPNGPVLRAACQVVCPSNTARPKRTEHATDQCTCAKSEPAGGKVGCQTAQCARHEATKHTRLVRIQGPAYRELVPEPLQHFLGRVA